LAELRATLLLDTAELELEAAELLRLIDDLLGVELLLGNGEAELLLPSAPM
jgi:hypothetical protein